MNAENNKQNEISFETENPKEEKDRIEHRSVAETPQEKERLFRLYELFVKINKRLSCNQ